MSGFGSRRSAAPAWKRCATLSATAALAVGLAVGAAAPSEAASTHGGTAAAGSNTTWRWVPLVKIPVSSTKGTSDLEAAVHPQKHLVVKGVTYGSLLAGDVPAGGTGAATFSLGKHCREFRSTIGVTDDSPTGSTIAFSVYFGDIAEVAPDVKKGGKVKKIDLPMSKVSKLVLRNTEPDPAHAFDDPTVAAWPGAEVLCNTSF